MSSIGPQLPPHLAKRKRSLDDDESPDSPPAKTTRPSSQDETSRNGAESDSDSDDGYGPSAPSAVVGPTMPPTAPTTRPSVGPTMPPTSTNTNEDDDGDDAGPAPQPQPKRIHGPAPPPAPLSERPPDSDSDSDDDDYGPALPTAASRGPIGPSLPPTTTSAAAAPERLQRDDWMLAPPSASDGYQERDPTKIKSRKFASGSTATTRPRDGAGGGISSIWTETPEEKAKRLADAVLGRGGSTAGQTQQQQATKQGGASGVSGLGGGGSRRDESKIRAFTEQTRGKSLYEEHQASKKKGKASAGSGSGSGKQDDEEDDDPSKRAFDREKDMALGGKITASQRKELLNRASDFGGRFSKGNYL